MSGNRQTKGNERRTTQRVSVAERDRSMDGNGKHTSNMTPLDSLAQSLTDHPPTPDEASLILQAMRWREDMIVVNDFGERVWLKALFVDRDYNTVSPETPGARRLGITDCCCAAFPCERHRTMANVKSEKDNGLK